MEWPVDSLEFNPMKIFGENKKKMVYDKAPICKADL